MTDHIKFKSKQEESEFPLLKNRAQIIAQDMAQYCHIHGFDFIITDILSEALEDIRLNRVSKSHTEKRAFDFRMFNWPKWFREKFEKHFEEKYKEWAALSEKTLKPNLIEYHDNKNGMHGHCQIKSYKE